MSYLAPPEPFRVVEADPPWMHDDQLPGETRGAGHQYPIMPTADLCRLVLPPIATDAVLCLWRVASMQEDALDVIRAWGFSLKTEIVWVKTTTKKGVPTNRLHFGMGRQVRAAHETCLIATRGRVTPLNKSTRSVFAAPVGRHSEKPQRFYQIIADLYAGPRVSLFSRVLREGWTTIGHDVGSTLQVRS